VGRKNVELTPTLNSVWHHNLWPVLEVFGLDWRVMPREVWYSNGDGTGVSRPTDRESRHGAKQMKPHLMELDRKAPQFRKMGSHVHVLVWAYSNDPSFLSHL
jgi:hypothetical protein